MRTLRWMAPWMVLASAACSGPGTGESSSSSSSSGGQLASSSSGGQQGSSATSAAPPSSSQAAASSSALPSSSSLPPSSAQAASSSSTPDSSSTAAPSSSAATVSSSAAAESSSVPASSALPSSSATQASSAAPPSSSAAPSSSGTAGTPDLFFSEYTEPTTGNSKAVELVNPTGNTVDLAAYSLRVLVNGGSSTFNLSLAGTLASGAVWVVCNPGSAQPLLGACNTPWGSLTFNGDDTLVLLHNGLQVDALGDGTDPGTSWGTAPGTQNVTLQRRCGTTHGITTLVAPFDPAAEWDLVPGESLTGFGAWHCTNSSGSSSSGPAASSSSAAPSSSSTASSMGTSSSAAPSSSQVPVLALVVIPPQGFEATTESGGTASFAVRLPQAPTSDVTVPVNFSLDGEIAASPALVTFTAANWSTPQVVTLTGVDDVVVDGPQTVRVTAGPATSADARYQGSVGTPFDIVNADNDTAGINVTRSNTSHLVENGVPLFLNVALAAAPSQDVTLFFASSDTSEATLDVNSLTFTPAAWNTRQRITVTPVDDALRDGPQNVSVTFTPSQSADAAWAGLQPAAIALVVEDDELRELTVSNDRSSVGPSLKGDGSRVAFMSALDFGGDFNGAAMDLIIMDTTTGTGSNVTALCSTEGIMRRPVYASQADVVVFSSMCHQLPGGNGNPEIYAWTPETGIEHISISASGITGGGGSDQEQYSVSSDGRVVAFATNHAFLSGDTDGWDDIYLYDRATHVFTLVTGGSSPRPSDASKSFFIPQKAFGGSDRYFIYRTAAVGLVPNDTNNGMDVFMFDRLTSTTTRSSTNQNGSVASGTRAAALSEDGHWLALEANCTAQNGSGAGFYVKDLTTGVLTKLAAEHTLDWNLEMDINADGSKVAIVTRTSGLVAGDTDDAEDVLVWDRASGLFHRASLGPLGQHAQDTYWAPQEISLAAHAPSIAFSSSTAYLGNGVSSLYYFGLDLFTARIP